MFALSERCAVLEVSISGYRAWKRRGAPDRKRLIRDNGTPARQKLHADGAEPGLDVGHHLPVDR